jgi:putative transposase
VKRLWNDSATGVLRRSKRRYVVSMGYIRRTSLPGGFFHVWIRGDPELAPFETSEDRTAALGMLLKACRRFGVRVEAACIMTTHYHAVLLGPTVRISAALQWFHSRYARALNLRRGRFGHVFAERFRCKTVDEDDVFDRCGYVLGNPVKAGICDRIEDWPWSYSRYGIENSY